MLQLACPRWSSLLAAQLQLLSHKVSETENNESLFLNKSLKSFVVIYSYC